MLEMSARQWKQDVLDAANDRFERRLSEMAGTLRVEMAAIRLEIASVRLEIARSQNRTLRWMFAGWLTLVLTIVEAGRTFSGR
jgi:uncharacterized membrane protein YqjE